MSAAQAFVHDDTLVEPFLIERARFCTPPFAKFKTRHEIVAHFALRLPVMWLPRIMLVRDCAAYQAGRRTNDIYHMRFSDEGKEPPSISSYAMYRAVVDAMLAKRVEISSI